MQKIEDLEDIRGLVSAIARKYNIILQIARSRLSLISAERNDIKTVKDIISALENSAMELQKYKKTYVEMAYKKSFKDNKKAVTKLKEYFNSVLETQKRFFNETQTQIAAFAGINKDAHEIDKKIDELIGINGSLTEFITYFENKILFLTQNKDVAEKLLLEIKNFAKKLNDMKMSNSKFFTLHIPIDETTVQIYTGEMASIQKQIMEKIIERSISDINAGDIDILCNNLLIELRNEEIILKKMLEFDKMTIALEQTLDELINQFTQVEQNKTVGILGRIGNKTIGNLALALEYLISLIPAGSLALPAIANAADGPPQSPPGIYASAPGEFNPTLDQKQIAKERRLSVANEFNSFLNINMYPVEKQNMINKVATELRSKPEYNIFDQLDMVHWMAIALSELKYADNREGLRVLDALDNVARAYNNDTYAEYNYAMGILYVKEVRVVFGGGVQNFKGASITQPSKWLHDGFLWLPIKWTFDGINFILPGKKVDDVSYLFLKHEMEAAKYKGDCATRIVEWLEREGLTRDIGNISLQLAKSCEAGGQYEGAYNMYFVSNETEKRWDTFMGMINCASHFNKNFAMGAAFAFIDEFKVHDPKSKTFDRQSEHIKRNVINAGKNIKYYIFDAKFYKGKEKMVKESPTFRGDLAEAQTYFNQLMKFIELINTPEFGAKLLSCACKENWKNASFVKIALPRIRGPPYDVFVELYDKAVHEKRFHADKIFFRDMARILGTYYENNNEREKWNALVSYYNANKQN